MSYRNLFVFLIFAMFLVGIGCVSAEDVDDVYCLSTSDFGDVVSSDNSLEDHLESDENELLKDSGSSPTVTTWDELKGNLTGNNGDSVVNIGANLTPGSQININHDVTIVGSADTYIGGNSSNNVANYNNILFLSTKQGISITLKNIKFQNCGGNTLIKFAGNGNYILDNCTFENITAQGTKQVIVHLNWGNCNITKCTFEKCYTDYGAVSNFKSDYEPNKVHMVVRETIFKNNNASTEPGAINNCGQLIVYDSIFDNNEAFWWAGAIHTHTNANTTIIRSNFTNNVAGWNGGALYTYSYLTVINSTFIANVARGVVSGGAIAGSNYGSNARVIINNSVFKYNHANSKGGAISIWDAGYLKVYNSEFINNTEGDHFNDISYSYSGSNSNAAYLIYINNTFVGPNNASGAVSYGNSYLNVINSSNRFIDSGDYVEPINNGTTNNTNDTNGTDDPIGDFVEIPEDTHIGTAIWNVSLGSALSGTPVVQGDYIIIPAGHTLYCYYTNGTYAWNVTNPWAYFYEVLVNGSVVYAPCSGDKLYILDLSTGASLTNNNIYQGSSMYAPIIYDGMIYICGEYGYGDYDTSWITIVEYDGEDYSYYGGIFDFWGVEYGTQIFVSNPIGYDDDLFVNTIYGLILYDIPTQAVARIEDTIGSPVIDEYGNIYINGKSYSGQNQVLKINSTGLSGIDIDANCELLVMGNDSKVYTVDEMGFIYCVDFDEEFVSLFGQDDVFHINNVSSAMAFNDQYIYIGDDEGILWVIDTDNLMEDYLCWAFNANSSIVGGITIVDDVVYMGTEDGTFYAVIY